MTVFIIQVKLLFTCPKVLSLKQIKQEFSEPLIYFISRDTMSNQPTPQVSVSQAFYYCFVFVGKKKYVFRSLAHFLIGLFVFFDIEPRSLRIFSPILWLVFSFCLLVSFAIQKLLSLIRFQFTFVFISITLRDGQKKIFAVIYIKECSAYVFL